MLWDFVGQDAEEVRQMVEEIEGAYSAIESLTTLLRLLLDRIRAASPADLADLKHHADEIEALILQATKRPDKVN